VRCGGRWLTSETALQRFLEELTPDLEVAGVGPGVEPKQRGNSHQASVTSAEQELERLGI
jgi:hypothetical protein